MRHARVGLLPDTPPSALVRLPELAEAEALAAAVAGTEKLCAALAKVEADDGVCGAVAHKDGERLGMAGQKGGDELGAEREPRREGNDARHGGRLCQAGQERNRAALGEAADWEGRSK